MIENRIFSCVPFLWKEWFLKYITFEKMDENQEMFCGVSLKNNKIYFHYKESAFNKLSDNEISMLIKHEVAHIIRGDLLVSRDYDIRTANIAMDAIINNILKIGKIGEYEGITLDSLREAFPEIPEYPYGWKEIYDILLRNKVSNIILIDKVDFSDDNSYEILEDAVTDLMIYDPKIIESVKFSNAFNNKLDIKVTTSKLLESIIRRIKSYSGNKLKRRTYRKEHPTNNMLKNISRVPLNKILLVLDVSGSYTSYTNTIMGLFYWINKTKDLLTDLGVFSNSFHIIPRNKLNSIPGYGGGTSIKGMFDYLQKNRYDLVIVFTDGEIFDYDDNLRGNYKGKILWILDNNDNISIYKKGKDEVLINDKIFKNN